MNGEDTAFQAFQIFSSIALLENRLFMMSGSISLGWSGLEFAGSKASQSFSWVIEQPIERQVVVVVVILFLSLLFCYYLLKDDEVLPVVNRLFRLEPRVFARFRWAFKSKQILEDADEKVVITSFFRVINADI